MMGDSRVLKTCSNSLSMIMVDNLGSDNLYLAPIPPLERHGGGKGRHLGAELGADGGGYLSCLLLL